MAGDQICENFYKCQKDKNWKCSQSQSFWATYFLLCRMFHCDPMKVPTKLEQNPHIFNFFQIFWDFWIIGQTNLAMGVTFIVNEKASFGLWFGANKTEQLDFFFLAKWDSKYVFKIGILKTLCPRPLIPGCTSPIPEKPCSRQFKTALFPICREEKFSWIWNFQAES